MIRGVVLDPHTNQPVAGAELELAVRDSGPVVLNGGWKNATVSAASDVTGAFTIPVAQPGSYRVQARKQDYGRSSGSPDYAEVKLTAEEPAADVRLFLARFGSIRGEVVDDDTGKPAANLRLRVVRAQSRGMRFFPGDGVAVTTGADGQFLSSGLAPGEYAVEILRQRDGDKRVLTRFSEEDAEATDLDYENSFWPGGQGAEAALPVRVAFGASVWVGRLHARKVPYYRVLARIPQSDCRPGETMRVAESIVSPGGGMLFGPPLAETACGKDVLITGYPRGNYRLLLSVNEREREHRATASVPFSIGSRNITVTAPLLPGVMVDGRIAVEDRARKPDFTKMTVSLRAIDGQGSPDDDRPVPDVEGRFRIASVRPVGHVVNVSGLGTSHYVKEIRHNGGALAGGVLPLNLAAMTHSLTILVDDKVATLAGSVATKDGSVGRATVLCLKWPWDPALAQGLSRAQADADGRFQMAGLAPGEYRVVGLDAAGLQALMNARGAEAMQRIMAAGKKVELSPGGLLNVTLEPSAAGAQ